MNIKNMDKIVHKNESQGYNQGRWSQNKSRQINHATFIPNNKNMSFQDPDKSSQLCQDFPSSFYTRNIEEKPVLSNAGDIIPTMHIPGSGRKIDSDRQLCTERDVQI